MATPDLMDKKIPAQRKQSGQDLQNLRTSNLWVLLSAIRQQGPLTRNDLAHLTGLAPSSVTRLIHELEQLGLVMQTGKGEFPEGANPLW